MTAPAPQDRASRPAAATRRTGSVLGASLLLVLLLVSARTVDRDPISTDTARGVPEPPASSLALPTPSDVSATASDLVDGGARGLFRLLDPVWWRCRLLDKAFAPSCR